MTNVNAYDEYGIPGSTNAGRFQYTGQQWLSELGMYHYRARIYSPTLGRFLQTDPIGYRGGMNLYAYVGNDPVNGRDPSGLLAEGCVGRGGSRIPDCSIREAATEFVENHFGNWSEGGRGSMIDATAAYLAYKTDLGAVENIAYAIARQESAWTRSDFVHHYFTGGGRPIDLGEVGLGSAFRNSPPVREALAPFLTSLLLERPSSMIEQRTYIDLTRYIFVVGDTQLYMQGMCHESECFYRYGIRDWFRDPLDLGFDLLGGMPYEINYEWGVVAPVPSWAQ